MARPKLIISIQTSSGVFTPVDYLTRFSHIQEHFANPDIRLLHWFTSADPTKPRHNEDFKWHDGLKHELIRGYDRLAHLAPHDRAHQSPEQLAEAATRPWADMRDGGTYTSGKGGKQRLYEYNEEERCERAHAKEKGPSTQYAERKQHPLLVEQDKAVRKVYRQRKALEKAQAKAQANDAKAQAKLEAKAAKYALTVRGQAEAKQKAKQKAKTNALLDHHMSEDQRLKRQATADLLTQIHKHLTREHKALNRTSPPPNKNPRPRATPLAPITERRLTPEFLASQQARNARRDNAPQREQAKAAAETRAIERKAQRQAWDKTPEGRAWFYLTHARVAAVNQQAKIGYLYRRAVMYGREPRQPAPICPATRANYQAAVAAFATRHNRTVLQNRTLIQLFLDRFNGANATGGDLLIRTAHPLSQAEPPATHPVSTIPRLANHISLKSPAESLCAQLEISSLIEQGWLPFGFEDPDLAHEVYRFAPLDPKPFHPTVFGPAPTPQPIRVHPHKRPRRLQKENAAVADAGIA